MDRFGRFLLIVAMGLFGNSVAAHTVSSATPAANVAAFARLYGVVRYYYPGDAIQGIPWNRFAVYGVSQVSGARDRNELRTSLQGLFSPVTSGVLIALDEQTFPAPKLLAVDEPLVYWQREGYSEGVNRYAIYQAKRVSRPGVFVTTNRARNIDVDQQRSASAQLMQSESALFGSERPTERYAEFSLGAGLKARVPIALSDEEAKITPVQKLAAATLTTKLANLDELQISADQRLADIVVSWNVYRHFYPYWKEVGSDWDNQLEPLLSGIDTSASREVQRDTLRHLVALAKDGHGFVYVLV